MPLFKKRVTPPVDIDKDLNAVYEFVDGIDRDLAEIKRTIRDLKKMREESVQLTDKDALMQNMHEQIELYDELLKNYDYIDQDTAINSIRLKNVASFYVEQAKKNKFYRHMENMKNESRWM